MNIEKCYKYFEFLNTECDRYLKDDIIEEEEIHQLEIEIGRFIEEANNSDLPFPIKNKIADLKLDYKFNSNREYLELLGRFNFGKHRRQRKIKKMVEDLKFQIKGLPMFIKMNY
jgi:hypothetical protein